jgi:hypothetical protein
VAANDTDARGDGENLRARSQACALYLRREPCSRAPQTGARASVRRLSLVLPGAVVFESIGRQRGHIRVAPRRRPEVFGSHVGMPDDTVITLVSRDDVYHEVPGYAMRFGLGSGDRQRPGGRRWDRGQADT